MVKKTLLSFSGGKDSTAMLLYAVKQGLVDFRVVFADTGHEAPQTYDYVHQISAWLHSQIGVEIEWVRADFTRQIETRRRNLPKVWRKAGISDAHIGRVRRLLTPTDNPYVNMCIAHGRFPSTRAPFCTFELKQQPIQKQIIEPMLENTDVLFHWQGVRRDESLSRSRLPIAELEFGSWDPLWGHIVYRPLLHWTAHDVFYLHKYMGVPPNPLYMEGTKRVGCWPCIMSNKQELRMIAQRYPEVFEKLAEMERIVAAVSKEGKSTFFAADKTPGKGDTRSSAMRVKEWAMTDRGGRQMSLLNMIEGPSCQSIYGLCE